MCIRDSYKTLKDEGELLIRQARLNLDGPNLEVVEARYALFEKRTADGPR